MLKDFYLFEDIVNTAVSDIFGNNKALLREASPKGSWSSTMSDIVLSADISGSVDHGTMIPDSDLKTLKR